MSDSWTEGERGGGREGRRKGGREEVKGRKREREKERERKGGREGGREGEVSVWDYIYHVTNSSTTTPQFLLGNVIFIFVCNVKLTLIDEDVS